VRGALGLWHPDFDVLQRAMLGDLCGISLAKIEVNLFTCQ
jgi:hypothetical protein